MNTVFAQVLGRVSRFIMAASVVLVPLFFVTATVETTELPKQFLVAILVLLAVVTWVGHAVMNRSFVIRRTPLDIPLLAVLALALVSSIFARDRELAFWGNYDNFTWSFLTLLFSILAYFLMVQLIRNQKDLAWWLMLFGIGVIATDVLFIAKQWIPGAMGWLPLPTGNTVSALSSSLGIFNVLGFVVGLIGIMIKKVRASLNEFFWGALALFSLITLVIIGFKGVWFLMAVALFIVLVYAVSRAEDLRIPFVVGAFALLILAIVLSFFGMPRKLVAPLPVEVALASGTSWNIASDALTNDVKTFIIGSGPGTFVLDFSRFRPESFNGNFAWNVRFTQPNSVAVELLNSLGIAGAAAFAVVMLISVGTILMLWLRRPAPKARTRTAIAAMPDALPDAGQQSDLSGPVGAWFWAIATVWMTLLITMFTNNFGAVSWYLFFIFLALLMTASKLVGRDEKRTLNISLKTSPQYTLATSFGFVLAFSAVIIFGIFLVRFLVAEVAYAHGLREIVKGNSEQAVREFTSAVSYNKNRARYHLALSQAYLAHANRAAASGQPDPNFITTLVAQAVNESRIATTLSPNDVNAWEFLANMYATARAISSDSNTWVIKSLQEAIKLEKTNPRLYMFLANAQIAAGQNADARKNYEKAIALKPDLVEAYLNFATLEEIDGHIDEAINKSAQAILVAPRSTDALFNVGRLLYNRNKGDDRARAKVALLGVIQLDANHSNALYLLGLIAEGEGRPGEALDYYRRVLKLNPDNAEVKRKVQALGAPAPTPKP